MPRNLTVVASSKSVTGCPLLSHARSLLVSSCLRNLMCLVLSPVIDKNRFFVLDVLLSFCPIPPNLHFSLSRLTIDLLMLFSGSGSFKYLSN